MRTRTMAAYVAACLVGIALCAGCLGSPPPVEQYLRVVAVSPPCGGDEAPAGKTAGGQAVALMPLKALENLDRPAVLVADGSVLTPSLRWYWEGAPQDVMTAVLTRMITCQPGVAGIVTYRPRIVHEAVLAGSVTAFNVQKQGGLRFLAALRLEVWTRDMKQLVATREFSAQAAMTAESAAEVARAASEAATSVAREACAWLAPESGGVLGQAFAESAR